MQFKTLRLGTTMVLLVGVLAGLQAVPAGAATVRDIRQFACQPALVPAGGYHDTAGNVHARAIDCLAWYAITQGTLAGTKTYGPASNVTRGQMAAFVVRFVDHVNRDLLPAYESNRFSDLDRAHPFVTEVNRLAQAGVVSGGPGGLPAEEYGPGLPVTRAQMASFLARVDRLLTGASLRARADCFADDQGNLHEASIDALCAAGIVAGRADGTYAPNHPVRRDAMASFAMRLADLLVEQAHTAPPGSSTVTLKNPSLFAGDDLTGTIVGGGVSMVTARGCGVPAGSEILRGVGGEFALRIPSSQAVGTCAITFTVSFASGSSQAHERTVTVGELKIATLTVTPAADTVATHSTASGADANRGRREFTVTAKLADGKPAAGGIVDLRLVDAESVAVAGNGAVSFAAGSGGNAALAPASKAVIETVDGAAQGASTRSVNGLRLGDSGVAKVTVDSVAADAVRLVAYADPANDNEIKIEASGAPTPAETVAVGGRVTLLPSLASSFNVVETGLVTYLDKAAGRIGVAKGAANGSSLSVSRTDRLFAFDGNDQYRIAGGTVSQGSFLAALSRADLLKVGPYGSGSSDGSVFDIVTDNPQPPNAAAKSESTLGTVTVTITGTNPQQLGVYARFVVQRAPVSGGTPGQSNGTLGAWATVGEPGTDADVFTSGFQFVQTAVPTGMYRYRAAGVVDGQQSGWSTPTANLAVGPVGPRPLSLTLAVSTDNGPAGTGGANGILDAGDRLTATFDQTMAVAPGWEIRLLDRDGTVARLDATRASAAVGGSGNRQVTLTLTAAPQLLANGTTANVNLTTSADNYLQVLSSSGITGSGGGWNLPGSGVPGTSPTRTFAGSNARHPAAPTEVSTDPGANTVTIGAGSNVQAGEPVFVHDHRGDLIGQATRGAGATTIIPSPAIGPGQALFVVYRDTVGGPNSEAFSQSLKVTAQSVAVSGISPASGTKSGGTTVTVSGSGFSATTVKAGGGCTVFIGGVCVASVASITPTSFQAVTPASSVVGAPLTVQVSGVTNPSVKFTYTNSAPAVTVTSEPGAVADGETATYSGTASDPDGSTTLAEVEVQVRQGTTVVSPWATTTSGPTPWSWTSAALPAGTYTFEFRAVDDLGLLSPVVSRTLTVT